MPKAKVIKSSPNSTNTDKTQALGKDTRYGKGKQIDKK